MTEPTEEWQILGNKIFKIDKFYDMHTDIKSIDFRN
jgi:hypothetical protein